MLSNKLIGSQCWRPLHGTSYHYIIHKHYYSSQRNDHSSPDKQQNEYEYITLQQPVSSQHQATRSPLSGSNIAVRRVGLMDLAKSKLYDAQTFYDDFSGMSEVKTAQNKVIEIQNQLQLVQERRRHILLELTLIRKQMQDIHVELQKTVRGEHRYVELIKEEFDVIAREKEKNQIFQIVDQEERELFSHLTSAVKTSHEKERTQANNVKYWSIIGSCVGALLGIIATSINYYYRNTQFETIKKTGRESVSMLEGVDKKLSTLGENLDYIKEYVSARKLEDEKIRFAALKANEKQQKKSTAGEGWGSYLKRHTVRVYRFFIPNRNR
ncbi:mitochondrial potassium channel-like [Topomyia yanbarensis]|uniref:mitochondrial potassium channel-like n=1 Tax=Topomyia yanbarensis TaxID=2498891 RepID=UPI00273C5A34|nr:mitochondrial potassium channel-like [Topomyia yanbarensis]